MTGRDMGMGKQLSIAEIRDLLADPAAEVDLLALQADGRAGVRQLVQRFLKGREAMEQERLRWREFRQEEELRWAQGYSRVAGIDEAGRGPLAGPVVAAAVILPKEFALAGLKDSKKVPEAKRQELAGRIEEEALAWCVAEASPGEIDCLNIHHATLLAMTRAWQGLGILADYLLIDGRFVLPKQELPQAAIVKGDDRSAAIAAASILAKVSRDRMMEEYDREYPGYGFAKHKGYPTAEHREALQALGPLPIHRMTFLKGWEQG